MTWAGICIRCSAAFVSRKSPGAQIYCSHECGYEARKESNTRPEHVLARLMARGEPVDRGYLTVCRAWLGPVNNNGYGYITVGGRKVLVHRLVYELLVGPIPHGHEADHLCRQRDCFEETHLEAVTHAVNSMRAARHRKLERARRRFIGAAA